MNILPVKEKQMSDDNIVDNDDLSSDISNEEDYASDNVPDKDYDPLWRKIPLTNDSSWEDILKYAEKSKKSVISSIAWYTHNISFFQVDYNSNAEELAQDKIRRRRKSYVARRIHKTHLKKWFNFHRNEFDELLSSVLRKTKEYKAREDRIIDFIDDNVIKHQYPFKYDLD